MLSEKRVFKSYEILLELLKFSIRNSDNSEYTQFALINSFLQLLRDLEHNLKDIFNPPFNYLETDYDGLLSTIFKDELQEYQKHINTNEKKELIRHFRFLIDLANFAIDREGEVEVGIIEKNLRLVMDSLSPLLRKTRLT